MNVERIVTPGMRRRNSVDDLEVAFAVRRTAHRAQHLRVGVLQRHVHVRADLRQASPSRRSARCRPSPDRGTAAGSTRGRRSRAAARATRARPPRRMPRSRPYIDVSCAIRISSFVPPAASARASLTSDSTLRRTERAAQLRDDAERARVIAAFGDLEIRRRRGRRDRAAAENRARARLRTRSRTGRVPARASSSTSTMPAYAPVPTMPSISGISARSCSPKRCERQPATISCWPGRLRGRVLEDRRRSIRPWPESMNAQVLTTTASASAASGTRSQPAWPELADHHFGVDEVLRAAEADERDAPAVRAPSAIVHELQGQFVVEMP